MKSIIIFLFFILSNGIYAQKNMDSLFKSIKQSCKKYKPIKTTWQSSPFYLFISDDSLERYYICLDEKQNLTSHIGLSILIQKFDNQDRLIKLFGLNNEGVYYYWDYSPIVEIEYKKDTTIESLYDYNYCLKHKKVKIVDSKNRIKEEINQGIKIEDFSREVFDYKDSTFELNIIKFDQNGNVKLIENDVARIYQKFSSKNKEVIEQHYYDKNGKLKNSYHDYEKYQKNDVCSFSKFKVVDRNSDKKLYLYNDKDEHICTYDNNSGMLIIHK
jgi:hypothetical protein